MGSWVVAWHLLVLTLELSFRALSIQDENLKPW